MVEALRALLRAALRDPLNQRFQLLCEHSLPLQSPLLVYQQLMGEARSRVNACSPVEWQKAVRALPPAPVPNLTFLRRKRLMLGPHASEVLAVPCTGGKEG